MAASRFTSDSKLLLDLSKEAGEIGLKFFRARNEVRFKHGNSPVSEADDAIDDFLRNGFASARPDYGWLSEETADSDERLGKSRVVIVDPIDGTRGFIEGRDEWAISIAIVEDGRPVEAVLHCPSAERTFVASKGAGMQLLGNQAISRVAGQQPLVTGSKKILELIGQLEDGPFECMPFIPSLAYRFALVAIDELDGAFAHSGASEWDVAAVDLIISEAGGKLTDKQGNPIRYNRRSVGLPALVAGSANGYESVLSLAKENGLIH